MPIENATVTELDQNGELLHRVEAVAESEGVTPRTIRNWIVRGEILAVRVRNSYRIPDRALAQIRHKAECAR